MTLLEENLFCALRSELWQEPLQLKLTPEEAEDLLNEAREQAVEGFVCRALVDNNVTLPKQLIPRCLFVLQKTREGNELLNRELARFVAFIEKQGLQLAVVKGQISGAFYPHPEVRSPGDVDFYCNATNFPLVKTLVEKQIGQTIPDYHGKHINFEGNGVEYEMHRRLTNFYYAPHKRYFSEAIDKGLEDHTMRVRVDNGTLPTLPPELNVLFTYVHMFFHLICGGVGLRQICDLATMLHALRHQMDAELLRCQLAALGLENGFRAFGWILIHRLGLPAENFPYQLTRKDQQRGERAYRAVMRFGNLGRKIDLLIKKENAAHTFQTAWGVLLQSLRFHDFAPAEMTCIFPVQTLQRIRKMVKSTKA